MNRAKKLAKSKFHLHSVVLSVCLALTSASLAQGNVQFSVLEQILPRQLKALESLNLQSSQIDALQRLVSNAEGEVKISLDELQKIPTHVRAAIMFTPDITGPEDQGYYFFEQFKSLYNIENPRKELRLRRIRKGRLNNMRVT